MRKVILITLLFVVGIVSAQDKMNNQSKKSSDFSEIASKALNKTNKKKEVKVEQEDGRPKQASKKRTSPKGKRFNTGGGQFNYTALYTNENEQTGQAPSGQITTPRPHESDYYHYPPMASKTIYKDSAYYAKIVKKHGWWIGVGKKLTLKEASHLNYYFKLSKKNQAGNWTYIEAFDGYGNPTTYHNIGTYLANQYDDEDKGLNSDWRDKLQTVCKWKIYADASGKDVIQERALDSEGDVVYIYSPVKVGENEYTGSFIDSWGMPIFMRTDSTGNDAGFANFVHITRDDRGYEVQYSYIDRFGFTQKNKDGAYMTRREYDDMGNQIKEASLNIVGDYMLDDYGNCGWESTYDSQGCQLSAQYFDASWKPMRMPNLRGGSGEVYGFRFEQDKHGRDTAVVVIDGHGNPDVNEFGVHRMIKHYNEHGKQIFFANYDLNGNLIAGDKLGIAQAIWDFNSSGDVTLIEYKNANGEYVNGADGYCKSIYVYDEKLINISQTNYKITPEKELVAVFEFSRDKIGNRMRKWPLDNQVRIDSVDSKGRNTLIAWYDLDGNPIEYEGMHKDITKYDDIKDREEEIWLDKDGDEFVDDDRGYSKNIQIKDAKKNVITNYQYMYGMLKQSFQKQFTPGFEDITAQWDITPYGEHARVGWWDNLHYTCKVDYTMYGKIRTMVGHNEFDEPSYLTFLGNSGEVYCFSDINNGHRRYYDESGVEIPDSMMTEFKSKLPRVFCIEVTDTSIAYPLGLKNGDIIISYGDWITEKDLNTNVDYFYLETILKANQDKQITLLRHHPEKNSSEILHRNLPKGRTSDLGFYPHKIYYTQKEKQRLLTTCGKFGEEYIPLVAVEDTTILLAVQTKGGFIATRLYHLPGYNIKDPGIVLYAKEKYNKGVDTWSMLNTIDRWKKQDMFRIKGANLYITQDLKTTRHIDKQSSGLGGMTFIPIKVSMEIYNSLLQCYQLLGDSITSEKKPIPVVSSSIKIKEKQLLGKWQTCVREDDFIGTISLVLSKKSIACLEIGCNYISNKSYGAHFNISIPAEWRLRDKTLCLNLHKDNSKFDITAINVSGLDDGKKDDYLPILKGFLETNKDELTEKLIKNVQEDLTIKSVDKNQIIVQGIEDIVFKKTYNTENEKKDGQWINLGLSSGTLWATKNVGATYPSDYGSYYAWGETATKDSYKWETLKYCIDADGNQFSKYVVDSIHGRIDSKYELEISDDAAFQNMGKSWRIPKYMQLEELVKDCIWTWTTMNDHNGYEIVGPNGQSIFLPANGYRINDALNAVDDKGYYLSRTLDEDDSRTIYYHNFTPTEKEKYGRYYRYAGFGIRAVYEGE